MICGGTATHRVELAPQLKLGYSTATQVELVPTVTFEMVT